MNKLSIELSQFFVEIYVFLSVQKYPLESKSVIKVFQELHS